MDSSGQTALLLAIAVLIGLAAVLWPLRAYVRSGVGAKSGFALVAAAACVAAALGVYVFTGKPGMADNPFAARIAALEETAKTAPMELDQSQMLAILSERARRAPKDSQPLYFTGVIHASQGRFDEAARAFDGALRRDPANPQIMIELGAAMVAIEGRVVSPEALTLFEEAERLRPNDVRPVFYRALAASQNGRKAEALALWPKVLAMLPPDDPRRQMASMMLAEAKS